MANSILVSEETVESVGGAARGLEAGRRVGWARAFDAERRADSAEYDVNILRGDTKMLSAFAARAYGALAVTVGKRIDELFRGDNHELKSWLPRGALHEGGDAMRRLLGKQADELARIRAEIAVVKGERHALAAKVFTAARRAELERLVEEFGFPGEEELLRWLGEYAK